MISKLKRSTALGALAGVIGLATPPLLASEFPETIDPSASAAGVGAGPDGAAPLIAEGFVLSLDGEPVVGEPEVEEIVRKVDLALKRADVQITYDTEDPTPTLGLSVARTGTNAAVTVQSQANYPSFIERGEVRLIDRSAFGGARLLATAPLKPNAAINLPLPKTGDLAVVYRVYDKRGRFDETHPVALFDADGGVVASQATDAADQTAKRSIPVRGGTVTVSAKNIAQGGRLMAMGEKVAPDSRGRVALQRILPGGSYLIDVDVVGGGETLSFGREVTIETAQWLYVLVADATVWRRTDGATGETYTENNVRVQGFIEGETESGLEITASVDTGNGPLRGIIRRLDEKDPRALAARLSNSNSHLTYGDDSTAEDRTPTSGRVYLKVARDNSFALWGDFQADISGSAYLRNERVLYGAQAHYETQATTSRGAAKASLDAFVAQPDQILGRDTFRGTDGSVYFLSKQDVSSGTAVVTVVRRDVTTNRVVERLRLTEGEDYTINTLQGVVTLSKPLAGSTTNTLIETHSDGDTSIFLEVTYEYTPTGLDAQGLSAGLRGETWLTDNVRLGATGIREDSGVADQTGVGLDVRYEIGKNSFVQMDYARTDGPGHNQIFSTDGGLLLNTQTATAGRGEAVKIEASIDLEDVTENQTGVAGGYVEQRTQGFNTYDHSVGASTGDQLLYGAFFRKPQPDGGTGYGLHFDHVDNEFGTDTTEVGAEVTTALSDRLSFSAGAEYLEQGTATRIDVAARLDYALSDTSSIYTFAQQTVNSKSLRDNNRYGVGMKLAYANGWAVTGEISDGTIGAKASIRADYSSKDGESYYFGYEIDPSRTYGTSVSAKDNGRFVAGGRNEINDNVTVFAEQSYDVLGKRREQIGTYGVEYAPRDSLKFGATYAEGRVDDATNGDLDRQAISLSAAYNAEDLEASARVEYRKDREVTGTGRANTDTIVVASKLRWDIDESQSLLADFVGSETKANTASLLGGSYFDGSIGYALRPVSHDKYNVLASYRYVQDDFGQSVDGVAGAGAVQQSHILNLEGNYDLSDQWTLGAKIGLRKSRSAPSKGGTKVDNDALLAVVNARYHMLHKWDVLIEARHFEAKDAGFEETGGLAAIYRKVGENVKVGLGYNFTTFSDDLADLELDDKGVFLNIVAAF